MAEITRHPRHKVEKLEWSDNSWTGNAFRLWELIFWRRTGIRPEASVAAHKLSRPSDSSGCSVCRFLRRAVFFEDAYGQHDTMYVYTFHSWETFFMHGEYLFRRFLSGKWLPSFSRVRIHIPMLAHPGGFMTPASPYLFAIAFDAANSGTTTGAASITISLTVGAGSNRALVSCIFNDGYSVTGFTYAGSSTGVVDEGEMVGSPVNTSYARSMFAPASGTNDLVVSKTGNSTWNVTVASYSGVDQTDVLEAAGTVSIQSGAASVTGSVTTVTDNAWAVGLCTTDETSAIAAGTDTTLRDSETGTTQGSVAILDSNGVVTPAGSRSLACSRSGNGIYIQVFSMKPAAAAGGAAVVHATLLTLGVG